MMNRFGAFVLLLAALWLNQCGVVREITQPAKPPPAGLEGLRQICVSADTIETVMISKAETLISTEDGRYEAQVTLYAVKDSLIYISAVNNGFEILRAAADPDTIRVIDRLNRIVYRTPVNRRFGHQNPVNFMDVQKLVTRYALCGDLERSRDQDGQHLVFDFDEPHIMKKIALNRESLLMDRFDFFHDITGKYIRGERSAEGFRIYSNFMMEEFEIEASGGSLVFNKRIAVKMRVNPRRYTFVNL